jgi:hypothetical protein
MFSPLFVMDEPSLMEAIYVSPLVAFMNVVLHWFLGHVWLQLGE